ncbi:AAA family ATPase [Hahella ganghwensis]|uniref:AAA family ATPase n=1 Tax=Hahella ganghwensis TaxID=286420 RepID=UPI0012F76200|nr:AAA family ATPase [Hahella ganghwensis]
MKTIGHHRYRNLLVQVIVVLLCLQLPGMVLADCREAKNRIQQLNTELKRLTTTQEHFETIRQGVIPEDLQRHDLFPFALDDSASRQAYMAALRQHLSDQVIQGPDCEALAEELFAKQRQLIQLRQSLAEVRYSWLELPSGQLVALESLFHHWADTREWVDRFHSLDTGAADWVAIRQILDQWQRLSGRLAQRLSDGAVTSSSADPLWYDILNLPVGSGVQTYSTDPELRLIIAELTVAIRDLKTVAAYHHNLAVHNDGLELMLEHPSQAVENLIRELNWLVPVLFMRFFEYMQFEHKAAIYQEHLVSLYSVWAVQFILLMLCIALLLKLASLSARAVSYLQRMMLSRLGHGPVMRILNSLVWVIKPNAAWLVIWLLAINISALAPSQWHIFRLLAPLGSVYALFRAVRVLSEWLLARMHSRVDQFVSQSGASRMHDRAGRFSVAAVVGWALLQLTGTAGGGILHGLLQVVLSLLMWSLVIVTLRQYSPVTEKFIAFQLLPGKVTNAETALRKLWWLPFWPALFVLAQCRDLIFSLHTRLSQFESYHSFSLKLLRLRLETSIANEEEEKDSELNPYLAKSYRYWLLEREEQEQPLITLEQTLTLITEPLNRWFEGQKQDSILLLHGEHGAGKTHLIRQLLRHHPQWPVKWIDTPAKTCTAESVRSLMEELLVKEESEEAEGKRLIVIDQAENTLLAQTGHFEGILELFRQLHQRRSDVFFLVIMHGPSWSYLNRVFRNEHPFTQTITMPRWTAGEMRKLILSRHHASRRKLQYDDLLLSAMAGTEASSFRAADTRVFNLLWELSGGNPEMALHLWLGAASYEGREVIIALPQRPAPGFLSTLPLDACFVLLALVTHKALNHEELALITTASPLTVEQTISACRDQGVLREDISGRWRITPLWYGSVLTLLGRKNMIYN